jgi:hypothetical protein
MLMKNGAGPGSCVVAGSNAGYGAAPEFTPELAREIASFPTVAFGMDIYKSPIIENPVEWRKVNESVPDAVLDAVREQFDPMMPEIKEAMLLAKDYDWSPSEVVWTEYEGKPWIDRVKPLTVEYTWLLHDKHGEIVGLKNKLPDQKPVLLEPYQSLVWINNKQPQWPYGRAALRNIVWSWWQARKTHEKIGQFSTRAANLLLMLQYPLGVIKNAQGSSWPAQWFAQQLVKDAMAGNSLCVPNSFMMLPDSDRKGGSNMAGKDIEALAKATPWKMEAFSQGNLSELRGAVEYLMYIDGEIFRGLGISPRVGLESIHGSRADSQQHTETFVQSAQRDDVSICRTLNKTLVNYFLEARFGPRMVGMVRGTSQQISQDQSKQAGDIIKAALTDQQTGPIMLKIVDMLKLCDVADIPTIEGVTVDDARQQVNDDAIAQQKAASSAMADNQPDPSNPQTTKAGEA